MRVFVTGAVGQLGQDVVKEAKKRGCIVMESDIVRPVIMQKEESTNGFAPENIISENSEKKFEKNVACEDLFFPLDITDGAAVENALLQTKPDVVIHCAAWTAVDLAEEEDKKEKVRAINAEGTKNIAMACKKLDCKMIYISTDYVFDGQGDIPWQPDCKDYKPLCFYGQTKLEGELAVSECLEKFFIVRIAWVFGEHGTNFIKTMLNLGKKQDTIRVVCDQVGTPTYTYDLARLLLDMAESEKYGYYHATNEGGYISWYEFACEIFCQAGYDTKVIPVTTKEYGLSKAVRPQNSRLDKSKLKKMGFVPLPTWQDALKRFLSTQME